jgi:hypothetical protein
VWRANEEGNAMLAPRSWPCSLLAAQRYAGNAADQQAADKGLMRSGRLNFVLCTLSLAVFDY